METIELFLTPTCRRPSSPIGSRHDLRKANRVEEIRAHSSAVCSHSLASNSTSARHLASYGTPEDPPEVPPEVHCADRLNDAGGGPVFEPTTPTPLFIFDPQDMLPEASLKWTRATLYASFYS